MSNQEISHQNKNDLLARLNSHPVIMARIVNGLIKARKNGEHLQWQQLNKRPEFSIGIYAAEI